MILLFTYISLGVWAFLIEIAEGTGWKFALFLAVSYPVTICLGIICWIGIGIYRLYKFLSGKKKDNGI